MQSFTGILSPMDRRRLLEFSKERFVRGFDVTVGVFYEHWDVFFNLMLKDKLYDMDHKKAKYGLWDTFDQIYDDPRFERIVDHEKKGKWAFDMVWKTIWAAEKRVKEGRKECEKKKSWPLPRWPWGPECRAPSGYLGEFMQYQHLTIRASLVPESVVAMAQADSKELPARLILHNDFHDVPITPVDVKSEDFSFERLVKALKRENCRFLDDDEHDIANMFILWRRSGDWVHITSQQGLVAAVSGQRNDGKWAVDIFVGPLSLLSTTKAGDVREGVPEDGEVAKVG